MKLYMKMLVVLPDSAKHKIKKLDILVILFQLIECNLSFFFYVKPKPHRRGDKIVVLGYNHKSLEITFHSIVTRTKVIN